MQPAFSRRSGLAPEAPPAAAAAYPDFVREASAQEAPREASRMIAPAFSRSPRVGSASFSQTRSYFPKRNVRATLRNQDAKTNKSEKRWLSRTTRWETTRRSVGREGCTERREKEKWRVRGADALPQIPQKGIRSPDLLEQKEYKKRAEIPNAARPRRRRVDSERNKSLAVRKDA